MPRPRCRLGRATPPSRTAVVHELSQRDTDAFIFAERCADLPRRRTNRTHSLPPNSRRATPPISPDLIYDRHNLFASICVWFSKGSANGKEAGILLAELYRMIFSDERPFQRNPAFLRPS